MKPLIKHIKSVFKIDPLLVTGYQKAADIRTLYHAEFRSCDNLDSIAAWWTANEYRPGFLFLFGNKIPPPRYIKLTK